jgi:DMSO/TMAO reductase YedYZ heme-binding membrane subunit
MFLYYGLQDQSFSVQPIFCAVMSFGHLCSVAYHVFNCNGDNFQYALGADITGVFGMVIIQVVTMAMQMTSFAGLEGWQQLHLTAFVSVGVVSW